ncbi:hypothetical protein [Bradyrhizobium sp. BWC-3-1]|uniref:hypothetical protein n=1 Tax=Bradyrhizobium sp. BWC-3-1 TaxID=3080012 RepID=UPI00293E925D|nr:hypothetical protein [Bradyrhizobium sp. BWC-3-1]WOH57615.1 hypothetical protein RX329_36440 [Bradyrhizobium sp. BWC-3-1]
MAPFDTDRDYILGFCRLPTALAFGTGNARRVRPTLKASINPGKRKRDIRHFWKVRKNNRLFPAGTELGHAGKARVIGAGGSILLVGIFERIIEKNVIGIGPAHHHSMSRFGQLSLLENLHNLHLAALPKC